MPKLLCTGRLWGATLLSSERKTRINGNSPAIGHDFSSHFTETGFSNVGTVVRAMG
ncbi:hypothetical protein [Synechocystis sp. PCC 7509]|uniref:hypothetical protein n=1 Tax=Synechocystis sp. PCC 7509 TaxID=927677 RepID=UPI00130DFF41|nr:hypothetical protein [Synechocystis sp. PCC 7509]